MSPKGRKLKIKPNTSVFRYNISMAKRESASRKKSASSKTTAKISTGARVRDATKSQDRIKNEKKVRSRQPVIGSFKLTGQSLSFIKNYWKPLGGIVLVYSLLNLFLASGLINNASSVVADVSSNKLSDAMTSFSSILAGGTNQMPTMQTVLFVVESLVIIWALRHLFSGEGIGIKQAYYHSSAPLIPFVIILFVILLQLLPITLSSAVFAIVLSSITGNTIIEAVITFLFVASAFWSIYMLCSSVFALYIVTLPNMQPRTALRSAKNLVHFRRWQVVRRILFLPIFIVIVMAVILVPFILYAKFLVTPSFFILSMLSILYAHTYLYSLYKGLLE
jgi:hypothetical protein